jgi:hypothetical protein
MAASGRDEPIPEIYAMTALSIFKTEQNYW